MEERNSFLADSYERAIEANEPIVRDEVERQFEEQLSNSSDDECRELREMIEAEIKRRLDAIAPPDALY